MNFFNPGGVVMLYKNLQKFADKMNHERVDLLSSDISRLFTLCHILYNIGIVCITDR